VNPRNRETGGKRQGPDPVRRLGLVQDPKKQDSADNSLNQERMEGDKVLDVTQKCE
jgi:hypothetical protein